MTQAWFDTAKVPALYRKEQMPLNVWRGGTITEVSEEHQQTEMDKTGKGGRGELKWWPAKQGVEPQPMMQVYVTVQTTERNPADPDDNGLRRIFIPKNGHAAGSMFTETGNALKESGARTGLEVGGELYQMYVGETPSKVAGFNDRHLWKVAYRPPANQFFATEVPAALALQANGNGLTGQTGPPPGGWNAQPAAAVQQPWAQPAAQVQQAPQQYVPPAQPQPVAATMNQSWTPPASVPVDPSLPQAPQWPSAPLQSQPPTATPPAQQPVVQGQQWPPGGQQAYQPPPVDPRNPFG